MITSKGVDTLEMIKLPSINYMSSLNYLNLFNISYIYNIQFMYDIVVYTFITKLFLTR